MYDAPPNEESKLWALACHLSPLVVGFVGPLVIWLIKKDTDPFVARHGREALNFQITLTGFSLACVVFAFVTFGFGAFLVVPLLFAVGIGALVVQILAAVRAGEGRHYDYPLTLRLVR